MKGLEFPADENPQDALSYDAARLFLESATRVCPDFGLPESELVFLNRICRLTGGMPLAIELAAGWIDVLTVKQIADEIQHGIDILEMELHDVPKRHRSIRATFEHTWQSLTVDEKQLFAHLAVFLGGFTSEAARVIAGADLRSLRRLRNKALIQASSDGRHMQLDQRMVLPP